MILPAVTALIIFLICTVLGAGIRNIFAIESIYAFPLGFILVISLFYVTAFPFMLMNGRINVLCCIFSALIIVLLMVSIGILISRRIPLWPGLNIKDNYVKVRQKPISYIMIAVTIVLIVVQIVLVTLLTHADADDSFYIAQTNGILESGFINLYEPSTGIPEFAFQTRYELVGYEVFNAVLCRLSGINAASLYHTVLPGFILALHYTIVWNIGKRVCKDRAAVFLCVFTLINYFSGYSVYSRGAFAMFRIWQGKSILVNIVLPFLLLIFIDVLMSVHTSWKYVLMNTLMLISGLFCSNVGVYIVPLAYLMFCITYVIFLLVNRVRKSHVISVRALAANIFKLVIPVVCILPFVAIIYRALVSSDSIADTVTGVSELNYGEVWNNMNGSGYALLVFCLIAVCFVVFDRGIKRYVFGVITVVCFTTILNPLLCRYMATHITGVPVYWRLFWILPVSYGIAAFAASICDKAKGKYIVVILCGIMAVSSGRFIFTSDNYVMVENTEKISPVTKIVADQVLRDCESGEDNVTCRLLLPLEYGYEVRQYTGKIQLAWSRYSEASYVSNNSFEKINDLYFQLYNSRQITAQSVDIMREYGISHVVVYKGTSCREDGADEIWSDQTFSLLKINNADN